MTRMYPRSHERLGIIAGSPIAKRMAAEARRLAASERLPVEGDVKTILLPAEPAWVHAVSGTSYAIVYIFDDDELVLRSVRVNGQR